MSSMSDIQALPAIYQADDSVISAFIDDLQLPEDGERQINLHRYPARHFLFWLDHNGIDLETVDGSVIHQFLQHECNCCAVAPPAVRLRAWAKRRTETKLMRFVRFLEREGIIKTPEVLDDNLRTLDAFLEWLRDDGYTPGTVRRYRSACAGLIAWLHLARIGLRDLNPVVLERFHNRRFSCSIPGVFQDQGVQPPGRAGNGEIARFREYLVTIGRMEPVEPAPKDGEQEQILEAFSTWLVRHRGVCGMTVRNHTCLIAATLPVLGNDPSLYDAALIRRAMWAQMEHRSRAYTAQLTTSMRMYLRFLASEGRVSAALVEAVPTVPRRKLSSLPRYVSPSDIELAIASCKHGPAGIRERAILLLLARLALRAGDIATLRLDDINWDRAEIRVSGKSRRETVLPLPQDVGDALHDYITQARQKVDEEHVFLRAYAPYRPFSRSSAISAVARRALDRAGVATFAARGAHVFRHSQATHLLRSGASLDVVQSLLRHDSLNTTMIYAKADIVMLQEIAQCRFRRT